MFFEESDINFKKISDTQFEELCFELLLRLGYKKLTWRQGSADNGRDIEGELLVNNSLIENYSEKWFFECKNYSKGVPPEKLYSKIAWADAEKPHHLTLLISSHLSNNSRTWLEKISKEKQKWRGSGLSLLLVTCYLLLVSFLFTPRLGSRLD